MVCNILNNDINRVVIYGTFIYFQFMCFYSEMNKPECVRFCFRYFRKLELNPVICPAITDVRYLRGVSPKLRFVYFEWNVHVITRSFWHKALKLIFCCLNFHYCCISLLRHVLVKLHDSVTYNIGVINTLLPYIQCEITISWMALIDVYQRSQ